MAFGHYSGIWMPTVGAAARLQADGGRQGEPAGGGCRRQVAAADPGTAETVHS